MQGEIGLLLCNDDSIQNPAMHGPLLRILLRTSSLLISEKLRPLNKDRATKDPGHEGMRVMNPKRLKG